MSVQKKLDGFFTTTSLRSEASVVSVDGHKHCLFIFSNKGSTVTFCYLILSATLILLHVAFICLFNFFLSFTAIFCFSNPYYRLILTISLKVIRLSEDLLRSSSCLPLYPSIYTLKFIRDFRLFNIKWLYTWPLSTDRYVL